MRVASSIGEAPLLVQPLPERAAADVGQGVVQQVSGIPGVEQRHHVRMIQLGGQSDLGQETLPPEDGGELRAEDLERDLAVVLEVRGAR